jgi:hypothetical protein
MRIALLLCALVGCTYKPGSFASSGSAFRGQRVSAGCLDIAVERRGDLAIGPVLDYQFANRCDHLTTVDLGAVTVIGRSAEGAEVRLRPYDPRSEIHPVALDARKVGGESLAYWAGRAMPQVCVDVASLARDGVPQWLCFGTAPPTTGPAAGGAATTDGSVAGRAP